MKKKIWMILGIVLILDQLIKQIIISFFEFESSKNIIDNFLYITLYKNEGAAWGIFQGGRIVFLLIGILFLFFILKMIREEKRMSKIDTIGYGLLIGGLLGNFIDRLVYGYVIDFIDVYIFNYNFPIFNIADSALVIGVILIIIGTLKKGDQHD